MFDLEQAVAEWRRKMLASGVSAPVPLDELEEHLREDVEQRLRSDLSAPDAFARATEDIGQAGAIRREFKKVKKMTPVLQRRMTWILVGVVLMACWMEFGRSPATAFVYSILLAGLVVASFVDFQQFMIPDTLTIGGVLAGILCSLLLPQLHGQKFLISSLLQSLLGVTAGAGLVYFILRAGKLAFGRERIALPGGARVVFTESMLLLPDKELPYDELFHHKSDAVTLQAHTVQLAGRSYRDVPIRLTRGSLRIGDDEFSPAEVPHLEATTSNVALPREVMGFGDVKLMAAVGAFLGWQAVIFSLLASSVIGSLAGMGLVAARRREWSARLPYGPCIALGAAIWIFCGRQILGVLLER